MNLLITVGRFSGTVVVRYKLASATGSAKATGGAINFATVDGQLKIHTFT